MAVVGAAKRYGQAAFEVAKDQDAVDLWERDLTTVSEVLGDPGTMEFFESPAVSREAKINAIERILPDENQQMVRNLLMMLLERRRFHQIHGVVEEFKQLALEDRGIAVARVTTAIELTADEEASIRDRLSQLLGKDIQILPRVRPEIIGGIIAQVGDDLIDGSVRTQLATLRRRMVH